MNFKKHLIEWNQEKITRLWDYYAETAPHFDSYFSKVFGKGILKRSGLPLMQSFEVIDFGCGPVFIWEHLHEIKAKWNYTALDSSRESIRQVEDKAKGCSNFSGAFLVDRFPGPFPGEKFDVALLIEVVEHLKDEELDAMFREISRITKHGGYLLITTPNDEDLSRSTKFCPDCGSIFHEWQHVRSWSVPSLAKQVKRYGFSLVKAKTMNFSASTPATRMFWFLSKIIRRKTDPHMMMLFRKN